MKELTEALVKTPKRKEWLRQPFPYSADDSKDERRDKRDVYLYQVHVLAIACSSARLPRQHQSVTQKCESRTHTSGSDRVCWW